MSAQINQSFPRKGIHGTNTSLLVSLLLISIPFVQFGASVYLSVQMFCFLLLFLLIDHKAFGRNIQVELWLALSMLASLVFFVGSPYFLHSTLRILRELLCLFVIFAAYSTPMPQLNESLIKKLVAALIFTTTVLVFLQFYFYEFRGSSIFFVPAEFYTGETGTFADSWAAFAQEHALDIKIRPSSFYAEPSYLGFIASSLLVIVLKVFTEGLLKRALILILLASLALSQTLSGLIAFGLLLIAYYFNKIRVMHPLIVTEILLLVPIYFLLFPVPAIFLRLLDIGDPHSEFSGFIRLVLPFDLIGKVLIHSPLGVPQDELMNFLRQPSVGAIPETFRMSPAGVLRVMGTHNAFLNFFIFYGMLGIVLLWAFVKQIKDRFLLFYLFLAAFFNGALLSFDKAVVISTVFLIVSHWRQGGMAPADIAANTAELTPGS